MQRKKHKATKLFCFLKMAEILGKVTNYPKVVHYSSQIRLTLTLLHSERPKFHRILAVLSAIGLKKIFETSFHIYQ